MKADESSDWIDLSELSESWNDCISAQNYDNKVLSLITLSDKNGNRVLFLQLSLLSRLLDNYASLLYYVLQFVL